MSKSTDINLNKNSEDALLEQYLKDISIYAPLSDEEEAELSLRIQKGDRRATDRLVHANLRFVVSIARQYASCNVSMLDLIDEGNIALIKAASRFDASKGKRFTQYAVWTIRKAMEAFLPKDEPLMNRTATEHLPSKAASGEGANEDKTQREDISSNLHLLPKREQKVLKAYFGIGEEMLSMQEIGMKYGMKRERVRQIRNRALRRLHSYRNLVESL